MKSPTGSVTGVAIAAGVTSAVASEAIRHCRHRLMRIGAPPLLSDRSDATCCRKFPLADAEEGALTQA